MDEEPPLVAKDRIAFAAGILVIILTLAPNVEWLEQQAVPVFGDEFRLSYGYFIVATALGISLYFYAASVISDRRSRRLHVWGDWFYAAAILSIPALLATYAIGHAQLALFPNQRAANIGARLVSFAIVAIALVRLRPIVRALAKVDARHRKASAQARSGSLLTRALDLHRLGFFDMAVVSATNGLISIAKGSMPAERASSAKILDVYRWINEAKSSEIENLRATLEAIRAARNKAAHGELVTDSEQSLSIIKSCGRIIASFTNQGVPERDEGVSI